MEAMIDTNLKDNMASLYLQAGHEVKKFGNIMVAYASSPAPNFNVIFNFCQEKITEKDLELALTYASTKEYPFILLQEQNSMHTPMQELISSLNYKKVGVETPMGIAHQNIDTKAISTLNIKLVINNKMLEEWFATVDESFNFSTGVTKNILLPTPNLLDKSFRGKLFLVYNRDLDPIAASAVLLPINKQAPAGHYYGAVKPDYSKKGYYERSFEIYGSSC